MANIYSPVKTSKRNRLNTPIYANQPQFNAQIPHSPHHRRHSVKISTIAIQKKVFGKTGSLIPHLRTRSKGQFMQKQR